MNNKSNRKGKGKGKQKRRRDVPSAEVGPIMRAQLIHMGILPLDVPVGMMESIASLDGMKDSLDKGWMVLDTPLGMPMGGQDTRRVLPLDLEGRWKARPLWQDLAGGTKMPVAADPTSFNESDVVIMKPVRIDTPGDGKGMVWVGRQKKTGNVLVGLPVTPGDPNPAKLGDDNTCTFDEENDGPPGGYV